MPFNDIVTQKISVSFGSCLSPSIFVLRLLPGQPGELAKLLCPSGLEAGLVVPVPLRVVLAVDGSDMG